MELFPAIDLRGGQVVRLTHGDFARMDVYSDNPLAIAQQFHAAGAKHLHVVDLDGAKDGAPVNFEAVRLIAEQSGLFVEIGGGIRDEKRIQSYLDLGVGRVILGTVALEDFDFTQKMIATYGPKIAVGVDAKDGQVAVRGWLESSGTDSIAFCEQLCAAGVDTIIYTDIAKDGAMQGTNIDVYRLLSQKVTCNIMASGGISDLHEIEILRDMGLYGAILGKALYIGKLDLKEALALC